MQLKLKKLTLINFKGIRNLTLDFNHITNVYGDNATGKTTIFDAFLWLFFGKNSEDAAQFEIKRLDENSKFIPKQETEVEAIIHLDGQEVAIKKVLRQKWTKRRGELTDSYTGDENIYYWNEVPFKEGEFKEKIKSIIDETLFKLITNPFYFNTMKWQERRNILVQVAGNISDDQIFNSIVNTQNKQRFNALINALNAGKTVDEYKRELGAKKSKIKHEAESIPSRIDEVRRGIETDINFAAIREEIEATSDELETIQNMLKATENAEKEAAQKRSEQLREYNTQVQQLQQQKFDLQSKIQNREFETKQKSKEVVDQLEAKIKSTNSKVSEASHEKTRFSEAVLRLENEVQQKQQHIEKLREEYIEIDQKVLVFDDNEFVCPACSQPLPQTDIVSKREELTNNFNTDKLKKLHDIKAKGDALNTEIKALHERIENGKHSTDNANNQLVTLNSEMTDLQSQLNNLSSTAEENYTKLLLEDTEYTAWKSELEALQNKVIPDPEAHAPLCHDGSLDVKRKELNDKIIQLNKELAKEEQIQKGKERIEQLSEQESKLAQELAELEGYEFSIMEYTKAKVDAIEKAINGKFSSVRFKMFNQQVNGGEQETCETMVNSNGSFVPFSDANNAAKINAGVDIINTLCKHYDVYAPIFIDNRESVTNLINSNSQIVNLIVSAVDSKLRIA